MKKYLFLATTIATASLFTGCSNNEYVGDQPEAFNGTDGAIAFSMGKANTTRAGELTRDDAAGKLGDRFYVYGAKYTGTTPQKVLVFNTYKVKYTVGSANSTASNTKGWEYVGNLWDNGGNEKSNVGGGVDDQTIKYWDYTASKYNFLAFSAAAADLSDGKIKVTKGQDDKAYTVDIQAGADIEKLYFADYVEISKGTPNDPVQQNAANTYGGYVKFTFRNLAAKVRVGFYETVPGYSIQINKMYQANDAGDDFGSENKSKFVAICPNTVASQDSKITVKYYDSSTPNTGNQAYVSDINQNNGTTALDAVHTLTLGTGVFGSALQTTSSSPTWDTDGAAYTFVWPQKADNDKPLKIKVDYTLTSTDGSTEKIEVKGATATVPKEYVAWKANTAYTYIFKISDNTNGTTGTPGTPGTPGDPAGLYPITFDAAVVDMAENTYLTTVSTPSVTVSQDGTNFVNPDGLKFKTGETITLKVMMNGDVVDDAQITGAYINVDYDYGKTPEQNLKAQSKDFNSTVSTPLQAQGTAGCWVLKVVKNSSTTYVIIRVGEPEKGPETSTNP